jgi:hypothetical protein
VPLTIYYFDGGIIGRSSGRSSVGAAAYRAGEKLRPQSVGSAAYRSGEGLRDGEIVHDYTRKGGVVHSEILLPQGAPPEFKDRETLWNTVERRERRKDAQLAREFVVGLQIEIDLQEQIDVMREYAKESFVDKGMCVDFAIHHNEGNPHAHIMLTTRHVSPEGFGLKNTTWNDKDLFLEWRESWAVVNNRMFERKGLVERIDHRTLKEQGIDREPTIHLGHKAAALERQGIRTKRGDYNREIQQRNEQRILKEAEKLKELQGDIKELQQSINALQQQFTAANAEILPTELVTKLKTVNRINEVQENPNTPDKTPTTPNTELPNIVKKAKHRKKLRKNNNTLALDLRELNAQKNVYEVENTQLYSHAEEIDELAKNRHTLHERTTQLLAERNTFWYRVRKKKIENALKEIDRKVHAIQYNLWQKYRINSDQAPERIEQILAQVQDNKSKLETINSDIVKILEQQAAILKEYPDDALMIKRPPKHRDPDMPKIDPKTGRPKTIDLLTHLRKKDEVEKMRKNEWMKLWRIKPQKILLITSSEQKKRRLFDVIGNKAKNGEPTRLSVPPKKKLQVIKRNN